MCPSPNPNPSLLPSLFVDGEFLSHSRVTLSFKIDCDALTGSDLLTLATYVSKRVHPFKEVHGVPRGGDRFAWALNNFIQPLGSSILLADDVLTVAGSIIKYRENWLASAPVQGLVIFTRGPCPSWVAPIFNLAL